MSHSVQKKHGKILRVVRVTFLLGLTSVCAATITAADDTNLAFVVPPEYPVASHPQLMLNERTDDPLAARFPWVPEVLYYGNEQSVGPLDVDWLWPDLAVVDWDRDGLLDVVCGLTCGTYWRLPKEKQFRAVMFRNTGQRREGVPIFDQPVQVDLEFPHGSMVFGDIDDDGVLDLVTVAQRWDMFDGKTMFRWFRDTSKSGSRRFEYAGNLQDFANHEDLVPLEKPGAWPSLQVVDWDGDGCKDLIVGNRVVRRSYEPKVEIGTGKGFAADGTWVGGDLQGSVVFHKNIGTFNGKLSFATGRLLTTGDDQRLLSYFDSASAAVTDWNEDGLLDIVVSSFDNLFWYQNVGTRSSPYLAAGRHVPVGGASRLPYERGSIVEANWNPADRHNLILMGSSFPWYLQNSGGKDGPRYNRIQTLLRKHPPVSGGDFTKVAAGDLDADGDPDLVLGNEDGFLLYVQNNGDGLSPAIEIEAGGETFRVASPLGLHGPSEALWGYTQPVLVDWDGDGDLDLIVGSLHSYYLYLANTGTPERAVFAAPEILQREGQPLEVAWRGRPVVHDFDGDGTKDLLAFDGDSMLTVFYRKPSGKNEFDRGELVLDEQGEPMKMSGEKSNGGRGMLALMDWDEDGSLDLIAGNAIENFDGLRWYKNVGTATKWALARQPDIPLNFPANHYIQIEPVDWDGDGKLDLLAGSEGGWVYLYRRK